VALHSTLKSVGLLPQCGQRGCHFDNHLFRYRLCKVVHKQPVAHNAISESTREVAHRLEAQLLQA